MSTDPHIEHKLQDAETGGIYRILAYRQLDRDEARRIIDWYVRSRGQAKPGETITITWVGD